jgi:signal transduction histidine kinase/CheY-like chemotaxis protein
MPQVQSQPASLTATELRGDSDSSCAVLVEQIKALYKFLPVILIINLVAASVTVYGLWSVISQAKLTAWFAAMLVVIVARLVLYLFYRRGDSENAERRTATLFMIGSGASGLAWGVGGVVLFPPEQLEYQLFILFVLVGMGAGAVTSLTAYMPAFYAYILPSLAPASAMLLMVVDPIHTALGVLTVAYVTALSFFARNINRSFVESLMLRYENIHLVKELSEQKEQAEQANIAKSKFLAAASHDLRQPLHALTLFTSVLDESIQYPKVRKVVNQINASVQALQSLFNALLDISRLEAGVMVAEKTDFELQPLFDKLANEYNAQAEEKNLRLDWPSRSYAVHSDPVLLEQILRNFISNAIRYTRRGSVALETHKQNGLVRIDVADTGAGIPEQEQQAVFKEFHQLGNPERDRSKGLGLGLAIVQRIARLLDHQIELHSEAGKGSTFSIILNAGDVSRNHQGPSPRPKDVIQNNSSVIIVVIDDDITVREGMESLFEQWNTDVITAVDAADALQRLKQQNKFPHGIIADYRLREGLTGIDAIDALQSEYGSDIPALIVTGDIAESLLREVNRSGFQLLHKPVPPLKLRAFLRNVQQRKLKN